MPVMWNTSVAVVHKTSSVTVQIELATCVERRIVADDHPSRRSSVSIAIWTVIQNATSRVDPSRKKPNHHSATTHRRPLTSLPDTTGSNQGGLSPNNPNIPHVTHKKTWRSKLEECSILPGSYCRCRPLGKFTFATFWLKFSPLSKTTENL